MSAPICGCCDRTYVTTARFTRQSNYSSLVASLVPNPYLYDNTNDFVVVNNQRKTANATTSAYTPVSIVSAAIGLAWLGMILNGQKSKGVVILFATLIAMVCGALVARESQVLMLFTVVASVGAYLVGLVDVIMIANRLKHHEIVREWDWF